MIHDAIVPVTCDGENCLSMMPVVICGGESEPTDIEWEISHDKNWIIINGKHYCSQACADEAENGRD